ncbi:sterol desaturase family protein [Sandarakinorhabdus sp.]|uniref:sterol desaturase family protein n=1 Tax=Sandarakinorhabdus sp. TaxID=1916663 RepID=UPI00286E2551|nr:sterol desaturase family protein [Sandarakinorhabdus sp.]
MTFPDPVKYAIPVFIAAIIVEMIAVRRGARGSYDWRDSGTSLTMGLGSTIAGALLGTTVFSIGLYLWEHRIATLPITWVTFALCFVLDDLAYYVFHRAAHRVRWFWASHVIHHSSQHYNLSTALRQTWTGVISLSFIFRMPLILVGFDPALLLFCGGLNLIYQFFIHTETVRRLPWGLESWLNSPSHHRVHHGTNPRYLDRNYAGVLIIWDRMFGTFELEHDDEPVRYGIVHNLGTFNPLWAACHEWVGMARDLAAARSVKAAVMTIAGPPGWVTGDTSAVIRARAGLSPPPTAQAIAAE